MATKFNLDGQDAINQIRLLIKEVENLKTSMRNINKANRESFSALESGLNSLRGKTQLLSNKLNYLQAILNKTTQATNQNTSATNQNSSAKNKNTNSTNQNTNATNKNANAANKSAGAMKNQANQASASSKIMGSLTGVVGNLVKAFGIIAGLRTFTQIARNVYETAVTFDSLNFAMERITHTASGYTNSQKFMIELVHNFGVELADTTTRWIRFLAAAEQSGLTLRDSENIFRSMTKASAVLGLNTEELRGVYLALEQMLSKGKVTTEELRRQLGERLPGAMGIMAAAIGKTIPELDKMLKRGEVLSGEVLPKFARAVERAYDIENVNNVNTLISAQNRLTAAWQNFIKSLTQGNSIFKFILSAMLNTLGNFIEDVAKLVGGEKFRHIFDLADEEQHWEKVFKNMARATTLAANGITISWDDMAAKVKKTREEMNKALDNGDKERAKQLENSLNEQLRQMTEFDIKVEEQQKEFAKNNIADFKKKYDDLLKIQTEYSKKLSEQGTTYLPTISSSTGGTVGSEAISKMANDAKDLNATLEKYGIKSFEELKQKILEAEAQFNVLRKLLDDSDVTILDSDDLERTQRQLRQIKDLALEIQRAILEGQTDVQLNIIGDEKADFSDRIQAVKDYIKTEQDLAKNAYAIKVRDLISSNKAEEESLKASLNNQTLSQEAYDKFIEDRKKETYQKLQKARVEYYNELQAIDRSGNKQLDDIQSDMDESEISDVKQIYDLKRIAALKEYEESKKVANDKIRLEQKLAAITVEETNAIIDAKIALLKAEQALIDPLSERYHQIQKVIDALEATKIPVPNIDDWKFTFDEALEWASKYADQIGQIFDAIYERRIENINAEIEAEKDKYDRLIDLAEGDEEQRKDLERNRDKRIKELEAKRLKEEQKQARVRKLFAIADIGIQTALAIQRAKASSELLPPGFAQGYFATEAALISALGALQLATVLAQPIPQYEHGRGKKTRTEIAMINDGSQKEYVERNGNILSTEKKDAIVKLQPSDIVYKNYNDMVKKSKLFNVLTGGQSINQKDFDKLFFGIEGAIEDGFKKAKVINKNYVTVVTPDNSYKDKMSRWS